MPERIPNEDVIRRHAELTATYWRELTRNGVPMAEAIVMAGRYSEALVMAWAQGEMEPREPWED